MNNRSFGFRECMDKLEKAAELLKTSPDLVSAQGFLHTLLSRYADSHKLCAYASQTLGSWIVSVSGTPDANSHTNIIPFGTISGRAMTAFHDYRIYSYLAGLDRELFDTRLIVPLYEALSSYSSDSNSRRLQSLPAISNAFHKNAIIFWLLGLFKNHPLIRYCQPGYRILLSQLLCTGRPDCFESFAVCEGPSTLRLRSLDLQCEKYCVPDMQFLAYEDFKLSAALHGIRGFRTCKDCGSLFILQHGNQIRCCLCRGHLRHSYNMLRRELLKMSEYTDNPMSLDALAHSSLAADFLMADASKQNQLMGQILQNSEPSPEFFDSYMEFLRTEQMKFESYSLILRLGQF